MCNNFISVSFKYDKLDFTNLSIYLKILSSKNYILIVYKLFQFHKEASFPLSFQAKPISVPNLLLFLYLYPAVCPPDSPVQCRAPESFSNQSRILFKADLFQ